MGGHTHKQKNESQVQLKTNCITYLPNIATLISAIESALGITVPRTKEGQNGQAKLKDKRTQKDHLQNVYNLFSLSSLTIFLRPKLINSFTRVKTPTLLSARPNSRQKYMEGTQNKLLSLPSENNHNGRALRWD